MIALGRTPRASGRVRPPRSRWPTGSMSWCAASVRSRSLSQKGGCPEQRPLGQRLTWRRKPTGTRACRRSGGGPKALKAELRETRAIRRRLDCLNPSPQRRLERPSITAPRLRGHRDTPGAECRRNAPPGGRRGTTPIKGTNGAPTSRSTRRLRVNAGSPTGREAYGDGAPIVVAGVTTGHGGRESRPQGEGAVPERGPEPVPGTGRQGRC
jgi:hypothetical protein